MAKPIVVQYHATPEKALKMATAVISQLGYILGGVDRENGIVTFETGMSMSSWAGQKMSLHVMDMENGQVRITLGGTMKSHGAQIQVYDWGEARKIATKLFNELNQLLGAGKLISGSLKSGPCFVATAVYGDFDHPSVITLRSFRDETLSRSSIGRMAIRSYFMVGPWAARLVHRLPILKSSVHYFLEVLVSKLEFKVKEES